MSEQAWDNKVKFSNARDRARSKGRAFTITIEEWLAKYPKPGDRCRVCLQEMVLGTKTTPSADRRDNDRGYERSNVQFICHDCNVHKSFLGPDRLYRLWLYAAGKLGPVGPAPGRPNRKGSGSAPLEG